MINLVSKEGTDHGESTPGSASTVSLTTADQNLGNLSRHPGAVDRAVISLCYPLYVAQQMTPDDAEIRSY